MRGVGQANLAIAVSAIPATGCAICPMCRCLPPTEFGGTTTYICWSDPHYQYSEPCTGAPENWSGGGGTSFASPIMAGIQALVNQKAGGAQGPVNPIYYQLAAAEYGASGNTSCNSTLGNAAASSCIFYDVTLGDMDVSCLGNYNCYLDGATNGVLSTSDTAYEPTGNLINGATDGGAYPSTNGWDFATGIGTVNAANLVNNWPASLSATTTMLAPVRTRRIRAPR